MLNNKWIQVILGIVLVFALLSLLHNELHVWVGPYGVHAERRDIK